MRLGQAKEVLEGTAVITVQVLLLHPKELPHLLLKLNP